MGYTYIGVITVVLLVALLRPRKVPRGVPPGSYLTCLTKGHCWHEGPDTAVTLAGAPHTAYHFCALTWKCLRCGAQTGEGAPPPKDRSWDSRWCVPNTPNHSGDTGCAQAYRDAREQEDRKVQAERERVMWEENVRFYAEKRKQQGSTLTPQA